MSKQDWLQFIAGCCEGVAIVMGLIALAGIIVFLANERR